MSPGTSALRRGTTLTTRTFRTRGHTVLHLTCGRCARLSRRSCPAWARTSQRRSDPRTRPNHTNPATPRQGSRPRAYPPAIFGISTISLSAPISAPSASWKISPSIASAIWSSTKSPNPGNRPSSSRIKARTVRASTWNALTPPVKSAIRPEIDVTRGNYLAISASTFAGDIGNDVIRLPTIRLTAFETAASGGTIGTSPTPFAPNG